MCDTGGFRFTFTMGAPLYRPPPAPVVPDYTQYLVGWRTWDVGQSQLWSVISPDCPWPKRQPFYASFPGYLGLWSSNGIYAFKTLADLRRRWYYTESVIGTVALWGRVMEHARGYRAEFAYPLRLWMRYIVPKRCGEVLAEEYGVPVTRISHPFTVTAIRMQLRWERLQCKFQTSRTT